MSWNPSEDAIYDIRHLACSRATSDTFEKDKQKLSIVICMSVHEIQSLLIRGEEKAKKEFYSVCAGDAYFGNGSVRLHIIRKREGLLTAFLKLIITTDHK